MNPYLTYHQNIFLSKYSHDNVSRAQYFIRELVKVENTIQCQATMGHAIRILRDQRYRYPIFYLFFFYFSSIRLRTECTCRLLFINLHSFSQGESTRDVNTCPRGNNSNSLMEIDFDHLLDYRLPRSIIFLISFSHFIDNHNVACCELCLSHGYSPGGLELTKGWIC